MGVNLTRFEFSRFSLGVKLKPSSFSATGHFDWLKKLTLCQSKTNKTNLIALHCDFPRSAPAESIFSFQMTVESNYVIAIATLNDWLKRLAPVFQPMRIKTKTDRTMSHDFSRDTSELQVIARNCDWFIALPAPLVIGRSNCFGFDFRQSFENLSMNGST